MSALNNLNPDFFRTQVPAGPGGRRRQVVYSTLGDLRLAMPGMDDGSACIIDPDLDLEVHADRVILTSDLILPGGNVRIVARELVLPGDITIDITPQEKAAPPDRTPDTRPYDEGEVRAYIAEKGIETGEAGGVGFGTHKVKFENRYVDVSYSSSPGPAQSDAVPGARGENGIDAGEIELLVEAFGSNGHTLSLIARGGKGQRGGGGMNGAAGVSGADVEGYVPTKIVAGWGQHLEATDGPLERVTGAATAGGNGGRGGDAGLGGDGGKGGTIRMTGFSSGAVSTDAGGGPHGDDGEAGKGGPKGSGSKVDVYFDPKKRAFPIDHLGTFELEAGKDGSDGSIRSAPGWGASGGQEIVDPPFPWHDSTYLFKYLQKAKRLYQGEPPYKAYDKKDSQTYHALNWLFGQLADKQFDEDSAEDLRQKEIYDETYGLLYNYDTENLSLFGREENWAPRGSFDMYLKLLDKSRGPFREIEEKFIRLARQAEERNEAELDIADAKSALESSRDATGQKTDELILGLEPVAKKIGTLAKEMSGTVHSIDALLRHYKRELDEYLDCSMENILSALSMIAFDPKNAVMAVVQGGELIYNSITKVNGIEKSYIAEEISRLELDANDPDSFSGQLRGKLDDGDKRTRLLITSLESFENEMKKFHEVFSDDGAGLRTATASLKQLVQSHSEAILEYTTRIHMIVGLRAQTSTLEAKIEHIDKGLSRQSDPTQTGTISYLAIAYQNKREQMLDLIDKAERALRYQSGSHNIPPAFNTFTNRITFSQGDAPSGFTSTQFDDAYMSLMDNRAKLFELQAGMPSIVPSGDHRSEIRFEIRGKDQILFLKENRSLRFRTVPSDATAPNEFTVEKTGFRNNIRVCYIRPRLIFRHTVRPPITVAMGIEHGGIELLTAPDGSTVEFSQAPTKTEFTQILPAPKQGDDFGPGEKGSFRVGEGQTREYARPALFSTWNLTVLEEDIDLHDLAGVEIEFGCEVYQN